ncbi:MAG: bifunctional phosphoribosylaminoimidazolecarboxamide formyltransferase/IMP cyclohydrolase [Proteobacteria bacterium]|nr:bifunctional phosphoribosylaminoimidazolecarboxamide formyltransferase/IMP cyclohydrolase [Pseudomonadota bacterium]
MAKISQALISVSDKTGIIELAEKLKSFGVRILSTGGTAKLLQEKGIEVTEVADYTGFPEMLDGRVKTLHPKVHGGLLGQRGNSAHVKKMKEHNIDPIDMVVVNLYPFEATVAKPDCSLEDAIENIDIGGPTMLRSAAKNHRDVTVIVDAGDYEKIMAEMDKSGGELSYDTNYCLAKKVFQHTARYDGAITNYLTSLDGENKQEYPAVLTVQYEKMQDMRYGENPHQTAAFYRELINDEPSISNAVQLQGKELSFNNIADLNSAIELVKEFEETCAIIIKHNNACGVAVDADSLAEAYRKARACDPVSAFGGVIGFNRVVDKETAEEITSTFVEAVIAPGFDEDALAVFGEKKNVRLLKTPELAGFEQCGYDMKKVTGGLLVQSRDLARIDVSELKVVSKKQPTEDELKAMAFAWKVCKHVKSNAIIYAHPDRTVGVGAGQMSRVDSSKIAILKAQSPVTGTVMASDAFFPFRDGIDAAAEAGAVAVIQPGGSIRDEEVIAAADEHGMAMVFTGIRHFKH